MEGCNWRNSLRASSGGVIGSKYECERVPYALGFWIGVVTVWVSKYHLRIFVYSHEKSRTVVEGCEYEMYAIASVYSLSV